MRTPKLKDGIPVNLTASDAILNECLVKGASQRYLYYTSAYMVVHAEGLVGIELH